MLDAIGDGELDAVIRALAYPTRRQLYAVIANDPGLGTTQLAARVSGMTRWGVMKHLAVLRDAGLIQTLPQGRQRHHYAEKAALVPLAEWLTRAVE